MTAADQNILETISEQLLIISQQQADTLNLLKDLMEILTAPAETSLIDEIEELIKPLSKEATAQLILKLAEGKRPTA